MAKTNPSLHSGTVAGTSRTDPAAQAAAEAGAPGADATDLLIGLLTIGRQVTALAAEERDDTAVVRILYYTAGGGPLRLSELAAHAGLDHSTVSRHVKRLEDAGYLARAVDPEDRRAFRLELTGEGRSALEAAIRARAAIVERAMAGWPQGDRHRLAELIGRLAGTLEQPVGSPGEPDRQGPHARDRP